MGPALHDGIRGALSRSGCLALTLAMAIGLSAGVAPFTPASADVDVTEELECLALTIYFEARGEPEEGKRAVGYVVMNRTLHPSFPQDVCNVVRQGGAKRYRCQFTWWCDGLSDRPREANAWERSKAVARQVFWDAAADPTGGALWYHADTVSPPWQDKLRPGPKIGRHIFYRQGDDARPRAELKPN